MRIELIAVGTELLLGHTINTNAAWLSQELAKIGVDVFFQSTVGDNPSRIKQVLSLASGRSDGIIVTGGLGPTEDDITTQAIAEFARRPLIFHPKILKKIRNRFQRRKIAMSKLNERQAYLPKEAREISNSVGTAPGFILFGDSPQKTGTVPIIALPGVPREMKPMFLQTVRPFLQKHGKTISVLVCKTLRTTGLPESTIAARVTKWLKLKPPVTVGIYAHLGEVDLRVMAKGETPKKAERAIAKIEKEIRPKIKDVSFGSDEDTLESVVVNHLIARKKTLAVVESCTGGLLAHRVTNVSGSSKILTQGLVTYSNKSKTNLLGVPAGLLKKKGAVSREVALLMAQRIRQTAGTTFGIGITGIAGPTGGTKKKPVGLVYIALATSQKTYCSELFLKGSREEIKWQATQNALNGLRLELMKT
ncbi:MAG: competence/damage-inducible protein A [Candidatus Omnitrophica bacterium]|nr:competence/damage-inducible protein A [Candidatus Omnitrophota bacterium]